MSPASQSRDTRVTLNSCGEERQGRNDKSLDRATRSGLRDACVQRIPGFRAKVAELADAPDLGSGSRKALGVRLPPFANHNVNWRVGELVSSTRSSDEPSI